jgi:hypothetical protein
VRLLATSLSCDAFFTPYFPSCNEVDVRVKLLRYRKYHSLTVFCRSITSREG